jgi:prephenate dehydrogenase
MQITIIGTGLIGCSLGMALKKNGHYITGVDNIPSHLEKALYMGGIDETKPLEEAVSSSQLIVLCVPVNIIAEILLPVLDMVNQDAVVMDMGSTKRRICALADTHINRDQFVAAHPMAGVEHSGPLAAHIDLFDRARVIICDSQKSSTLSLNIASQILQEIRMNVIFMDATEHDRQLALVSHLPQFLAYALASLTDFNDEKNKDWTQLGGGGLRSSIRLGKSDADMWIPIFDQNQKHLTEYIDRYISRLQEMKELVKQKETKKMQYIIKSANKNYGKLTYRKPQAQPIVPEEGKSRVHYS